MMGVFYFPQNEPDLEWLVCYSPLGTITAPSKPFGDVMAEEYLQFAREDAADGSRRGLVNGLGNAKRAFHYQLELLLLRYGLHGALARSSFPRKLALLGDLRVVPKALLTAFNQKRNAVEHDYILPTADDVDGAIDLAEFVILATERFLVATPGWLRVKLADDDRDLLVELSVGTDKLAFSAVSGTELRREGPAEHYSGPIFELSTERIVRAGISIARLPDEDIPLTMAARERWEPYLRVFAEIARGVGNRHAVHPKTPMATIQYQYPQEELLRALRSVAPGTVGKQDGTG